MTKRFIQNDLFYFSLKKNGISRSRIKHSHANMDTNRKLNILQMAIIALNDSDSWDIFCFVKATEEKQLEMKRRRRTRRKNNGKWREKLTMSIVDSCCCVVCVRLTFSPYIDFKYVEISQLEMFVWLHQHTWVRQFQRRTHAVWVTVAGFLLCVKCYYNLIFPLLAIVFVWSPLLPPILLFPFFYPITSHHFLYI